MKVRFHIHVEPSLLQYFKFLGVMVVSVACHIAAVAYVVFAMREKKRESEPEMRDILPKLSFVTYGLN